jgi:hypothetical protein
MKTPMIAIACAVLGGGLIAYAEDENSEQAQFDARIEKQIYESYFGQYAVEKTGNTVRLTDNSTFQTRLARQADLALSPLRAKFIALCVLDMDTAEDGINLVHKPADFVKVLISEPDGTVVGEGIVLRSDYPDHSAIIAAEHAEQREVLRETEKWMQTMNHR